MKKAKIPVGTRVRWLGSTSYPGTIMKHQRFMGEEGYLIAWDNGRLGQHSECDFSVIHQPGEILKEIL